MKLRIFTEPQQGATYDQLLAIATATEESGFDAFFRSDHYLHMGGASGRPGPTDAWTTLAGLARETRRIRLGTLVSAATFRLPGPFAVTVAQVDQMSGGRVELGIGTGWFEAEHRAFGIPFPPIKERFDRLEETLSLLVGLWDQPEGETFERPGGDWPFEHNPSLVRTVQHPHPPIIVGGRGTRRTPALAARFADEFNLGFHSPQDCAAAFERVAAACDAIGRDPASLRRSAAIVVCCGSNERELARRAAAIGRELGELREHGAAGTPSEVADRIGEWAAAGAETVYLQVLDIGDLDHVHLLGSEVLPAVT